MSKLYELTLQFEDRLPDVCVQADEPYGKGALFNDHPAGRAIVTKCRPLRDDDVPIKRHLQGEFRVAKYGR